MVTLFDAYNEQQPPHGGDDHDNMDMVISTEGKPQPVKHSEKFLRHLEAVKASWPTDDNDKGVYDWEMTIMTRG